MIASLDGVVGEKSLSELIVDVGGVGYRVVLSLLSISRIPEVGQHVKLRIRTVVREDAFDLYGFLSRAEEELFLLLTSVSHVGPKMALSILSGLEVDALVQAIASGDVVRLTKIHGVGKKTAERVVLELKDKMKLVAHGDRLVPSATPATGGAVDDLVSALQNLGYKAAQAEGAARSAADRAGGEAPFELLFREALKTLRGG
jgi:holliday junction DNA helicase RuvA